MKMQTEHSIIALDHIIPGDRGNRETEREAGYDTEQLEQSIRKYGLLVPLIVRPKPDDNGFYVLVAGERRYTALNKIDPGQSIQCVVVSCCTILDSDKIRAIENACRMPLHPLDEARQMQDIYVSAGIDETAAVFGMSKSYCYKRLALNSLIPGLKDMYKAGKISASDALLLARECPDIQQQALAAVPERLDIGEYLGDRHCSLKNAAFPQDECGKCQSRSSVNPVLFDDMADDMCLNGDCYRKKKQDWINMQYENLKKALGHEPECVIRETYTANTYNGQKIKDGYDYTEVQEGTPGSRPAVIVQGQEAGKIISITDRQKKEEKPETKQDAERREKQEKIKELDEICYIRVMQELEKKIADAPIRELAGYVINHLCLTTASWGLAEYVKKQLPEEQDKKDKARMIKEFLSRKYPDDIVEKTCLVNDIRKCAHVLLVSGLDNNGQISEYGEDAEELAKFSVSAGFDPAQIRKNVYAEGGLDTGGAE